MSLFLPLLSHLSLSLFRSLSLPLTHKIPFPSSSAVHVFLFTTLISPNFQDLTSTVATLSLSSNLCLLFGAFLRLLGVLTCVCSIIVSLPLTLSFLSISACLCLCPPSLCRVCLSLSPCLFLPLSLPLSLSLSLYLSLSLSLTHSVSFPPSMCDLVSAPAWCPEPSIQGRVSLSCSPREVWLNLSQVQGREAFHEFFHQIRELQGNVVSLRWIVCGRDENNSLTSG